MSRATPYMDAWKQDLREVLDQVRGSRTELARWLSGGDATKVFRRKVQLAKVLNGSVVPDGEFVLSVNDWMRQIADSPKSPTLQRRRKTQ